MELNLLEYRSVTASYENSIVLQDINFSIHSGEILGIVGESGSGKSTLLKACLGLLGNEGRAEQGEILFCGENLLAASEKRMRQIRGRRIGLVSQNPGASLCPVRKIRDQFYETIREHQKLSKESAQEEMINIFEKMNLKDGERILDSYPFELSGGMNQRVAIAMAMILKPELILADEPTSALDVMVQSQVINQLMQLRVLFGTGLLIVTHNIGVAAHMADRIVVMKEGRIVETGSRDNIIQNPCESYTSSLIHATPRLNRGSTG